MNSPTMELLPAPFVPATTTIRPRLLSTSLSDPARRDCIQQVGGRGEQRTDALSPASSLHGPIHLVEVGAQSCQLALFRIASAPEERFRRVRCDDPRLRSTVLDDVHGLIRGHPQDLPELILRDGRA